MLREEGGGGVEEGSRVICVNTNGVRYIHTILSLAFIECEPTCHCDECKGRRAR